MLTAVQYTGFALEYASEALRSDRDIAMSALTNYGRWRDIAPILRQDVQFITQLFLHPRFTEKMRREILEKGADTKLVRDAKKAAQASAGV